MKKLITLCLLILPLTVSSQKGTPFITHYEGGKNQDIQNWAICQDGQDVMYFANRHGLLAFDGYRWENIRLPNTPMSVAMDNKSGRLYIGALNNFGFLEKDSKGNMNYTSLSLDTLNLGIISGISIEDDFVLFYGEESVSEFDSELDRIIKQWFAVKDEPFTGVVYIDNRLYINVETKGLHRIDNDTLFPIVNGYMTKNSEILFTIPYSEDRVLIGRSDNMLALFDGMKFYDYSLSNKTYLQQNVLSDGVAVGDRYFAFSTLYGGAIVVDKHSGDIIHTINYQNGLPDDEIYAMGSDSNEGLWLSHSYGVSRVDLKLPVLSYSGFPGLEGVLSSALIDNNRLYIATNTGLYILDEVRNYTEVEEYYKITQVVKHTEPEKIELKKEDVVEEVVPEQEEEEKKPVRKIFSRIFGKKTEIPATTVTDEKEVEEEEIKEVVEKPVVTRPVYGKRTVRKLQSIHWIYRKIEDIDTRCNALVPTEHGLVAITGSGLFSINGLEATRIVDDRSINAVTVFNGRLVIGSLEGLFTADFESGKWNVDRSTFNHKTPVYSLTMDNSGLLWAGGNNVIYRFEEIENNKFGEKGWYYYDSEFQENCMIDNVNDTIMLFAESGIEYFSTSEESFLPYVSTRSLKDGATSMRYIMNQPGLPWIYDGREWYTLNTSQRNEESIARKLRLFDDITSITLDGDEECWVIDDRKGIYAIKSSEESETDPSFKLFISKIYNEEGRYFGFTDLVFEPGEKAINLKLSAPHFIKETSTQYQYLIDDMMKTWSAWSYNPDINLFLPSGDYNIRLRARNILGRVSEEETLSFSIKPPFTKTMWFFILMSVSGIGLIWLITDLRQRKLKRDKKILEQKVKERTIELEKRKAQIETQRDEILNQKEEITSSITYARRIQEAILPENELLEKNFEDHFVMFKPRNIVSGDFFWIAESRSFAYFAVADCTGHGVPGAIMSMLGISLLNEITGEGTINLHADEVLNILRDKIVSALHQQGKDDQTSDGMDITLCKYIRKDKSIEFSGAFNPLLHYRDNKLNELKADRQPIGYFEKSKKFTRHIIKIKKGDTLFLFSDGYYDQFGGPDDKRFSTKRLKSTLTGIVEMSMKEQFTQLEETFRLWKGDQEQVDDVTVLGVRF